MLDWYSQNEKKPFKFTVESKMETANKYLHLYPAAQSLTGLSITMISVELPRI